MAHVKDEDLVDWFKEEQVEACLDDVDADMKQDEDAIRPEAVETIKPEDLSSESEASELDFEWENELDEELTSTSAVPIKEMAPNIGPKPDKSSKRLENKRDRTHVDKGKGTPGPIVRGRQVYEKVAKTATISKHIGGGQCQFRCPKCRTKSVSWAVMVGHKCAAGKEKISICELERYITFVTAHVCNICNSRVLCDSSFVYQHLHKHKLTVEKYREMFGCQDFPSEESECVRALAEIATVSHGKLGPLCQFCCPMCKKGFHFKALLSHECVITEKVRVKLTELHLFATKVVLHPCKICGEKVLCDPEFVLKHMKRKHNISPTEYRKKYHCKRVGENFQMTDKICEKAILSEMIGGRQCQFYCPKCETKSTCWSSFYKHQCGNQRVILSNNNLDKYVIGQAVVHQCKICSKKILCDIAFVTSHISWHKMTLKEYRDKFNCDDFPHPAKESKELVRKIATISPKIGYRQCRYRCPNCKNIFDNWRGFKRHPCRHLIVISRKFIHKYAIKIVTHQCKICFEQVLCDAPFLSDHMKKHSMSLEQYINSNNCSEFVKSKAQVLSEGTLTSEVGNLCRYKCEQCCKTFVAITSFYHHMKTLNHGQPTHNINEVSVAELRTHKCRVCEKIVACDTFILTRHFKNNPGHKIKDIKDYCNQFGVKMIKSGTFQKISAISRDVGNLCDFKCPNCSYSTNSWSLMWKHNQATKHVKISSQDRAIHFLTSCVLHKCVLCDKTIYCDKSYLATHLYSAHSLSIAEYVEMIGLSATPTATLQHNLEVFKRATKPFPTFKALDGCILPKGTIPDNLIICKAVGNLCLFQCNKCESKNFLSYKRLCNHVKQAHNSRCLFKPESVEVARYHQCMLCPKVILCDDVFLSGHLKKKHKMPKQQYFQLFKQRGGQVVAPEYVTDFYFQEREWYADDASGTENVLENKQEEESSD